MKFTAVLALVAAATVVSAETNAQRFARGLPPNAPSKRATRVTNARRGSPSGTPSQCNTGTLQCCNSVTTSSNSQQARDTLDSLGITNVASSVPLGLDCSSITAVGTGGNTCQQQPVCCENNTYNGLINIGCSPININL